MQRALLVATIILALPMAANAQPSRGRLLPAHLSRSRRSRQKQRRKSARAPQLRGMGPPLKESDITRERLVIWHWPNMPALYRAPAQTEAARNNNPSLMNPKKRESRIVSGLQSSQPAQARD